MSSPNIHILEAIRDDLHDFSTPDNRNGFLPFFCEWVIHEWNHRPYYISEIVNFGYDLSHYPQKTDFLLREKALTYRDFIHANNGYHHATYLPGHGSSCETMEKNLYEFFHESMRLRALTFLEENYPEVEAEVFWNQIFCEDFDERRELIVSEEISVYFGFYGLSAEPYTCHPNDLEEFGEGRFACWEEKDFRAALTLLKTKDKDQREEALLSMGRAYATLAEALGPRALKKPLSQNGAIA